MKIEICEIFDIVNKFVIFDPKMKIFGILYHHIFYVNLLNIPVISEYSVE